MDEYVAMDEFEEMLDNRLKNFVKDCKRAFSLTCAFTDRTMISADEFVAKVKDYGAVKSDVEFYDCYYKTEQCFETYRLTNDAGGQLYIRGVHPEKYEFDMNRIMEIDKRYTEKND